MQRFQAAGATGAMSGALWYATAMILKLPKPYWKPALFGFLGEFVVHMNSDPPSVVIDEQSGKVDAWWLPSQIGYWGKGGVSHVAVSAHGALLPLPVFYFGLDFSSS